MINRKSLSRESEVVLSAIADAHLSGDLEVELSELRTRLGLSESRLREVRAELFERGLLDRIDNERNASLSAYGLRCAKELKQRSAETDQTLGDNQENAIEGYSLYQEWVSLLERVGLSSEERGRLSDLGAAFLQDPAVPPLLSQLIENRR